MNIKLNINVFQGRFTGAIVNKNTVKKSGPAESKNIHQF